MSELSGQVRDHDKKLRSYTGIGLNVPGASETGHLLVYSEPSGDDYAKSLKHKLGLTVPLPAPLGFELDTAEF